MATNLNLNNDLVEQACRVGKHRTKREAVNAALKEYIQRRQQLGLVQLFGQVEYDSDYDYKRERERRKNR